MPGRHLLKEELQTHLARTRGLFGGVTRMVQKARQLSEQPKGWEFYLWGVPLTISYSLWNSTDMVDGEGAGVTSVSLTVLPFALRTKVFSRCTSPWLL